MLKVEDIHTYYGESYVLQGISFEIPKGVAVVILGRNGMGKTTLVRSIMGFTPPKRGKIIFKGMDTTHLLDYKRATMGMGLVPQGRYIFHSLTVKENILIGARGDGKWNLDEIYNWFPGLKARARHLGNKLSGGEQQMLAIARALMTNPDLLLMDEPTEGLAPVLVQNVAEIMLRLKESGNTIFLVEQNISMALKVADVTHVLSRGRIVYSSSPQELWQNEEIKNSYLGI